MSRPLRITFPGAIYHMTSRGNAQAAIYADDADRRAFVDLLTQIVQRYHWLCHAYGLMDNHYHLLIETLEGHLSQGARQRNGVYTQQANRSQDRMGHVLQGRYKAILVEKDSYLLELGRYVVLNPARAEMVRSAREYRWSSYRATARSTDESVVSTVDPVEERRGIASATPNAAASSATPTVKASR